MNAPEFVAVVDVGKTHAKLLLLDAGSGQLEAAAERPRTVLAGEVVSQLDLAATETWLLDALAAAPRRAHITDLVPVAHGAAAALVDADGALLSAPDYEDPAFDAVAAAYRAERDPFALTGSPELPLGLNLGRQLYYLETRQPALWTRAARLLLHPQYWAWRLSGVAASEVTSLACHTDLWQPRTASPSPLARRRGWDTLLPPLRRADAVLGPVQPALARRLGLTPTCRVRCGIHDSNASWLAHRTSPVAARAERFAVISSGTWIVLMARGTELARLDPARDMLVNVDAGGEAVATARFMGGREYAALAGAMPAPATAADVLAVLRSGALALPSFADAGGAWAGQRGRLVGAEGLTAAERAALATLYVALVCDARLDDLGAAGPIIVDGPLAADALFLATLAALRPASAVHAASARAGIVQGALRLAGCRQRPEDPGPAATALDAPGLAGYRARWRAQCTALTNPPASSHQ